MIWREELGVRSYCMGVLSDLFWEIGKIWQVHFLWRTKMEKVFLVRLVWFEIEEEGKKVLFLCFHKGKVRTEHIWDSDGSLYSSFVLLVQLMFAAFHPDTFKDENLTNQVYAKYISLVFDDDSDTLILHCVFKVINFKTHGK